MTSDSLVLFKGHRVGSPKMVVSCSIIFHVTIYKYKAQKASMLPCISKLIRIYIIVKKKKQQQAAIKPKTVSWDMMDLIQ